MANDNFEVILSYSHVPISSNSYRCATSPPAPFLVSAYPVPVLQVANLAWKSHIINMPVAQCECDDYPTQQPCKPVMQNRNEPHTQVISMAGNSEIQPKAPLVPLDFFFQKTCYRIRTGCGPHANMSNTTGPRTPTHVAEVALLSCGRTRTGSDEIPSTGAAPLHKGITG
jgi:hypothetical protein